jgi:hypothetical protein
MVVVRSSKNLPLGKTMNDLRTWLDSERIEPVVFKTVGGRFEIGFGREREAERFQRRFAPLLRGSAAAHRGERRAAARRRPR